MSKLTDTKARRAPTNGHKSLRFFIYLYCSTLCSLWLSLPRYSVCWLEDVVIEILLYYCLLLHFFSFTFRVFHSSSEHPNDFFFGRRTSGACFCACFFPPRKSPKSPQLAKNDSDNATRIVLPLPLHRTPQAKFVLFARKLAIVPVSLVKKKVCLGRLGQLFCSCWYRIHGWFRSTRKCTKGSRATMCAPFGCILVTLLLQLVTVFIHGHHETQTTFITLMYTQHRKMFDLDQWPWMSTTRYTMFDVIS